MAEPATTAAAAGGAAAFKAMGGAAGAGAVGATAAAIVVMCMSPPRSKREWVVGLISTVVSSIAGGAYALERLGFGDLAHQGATGLAVLFGLAFVCGLPGWTLVRTLFNYMDKKKNASIDEIYKDVKSQL